MGNAQEQPLCLLGRRGERICLECNRIDHAMRSGEGDGEEHSGGVRAGAHVTRWGWPGGAGTDRGPDKKTGRGGGAAPCRLHPRRNSRGCLGVTVTSLAADRGATPCPPAHGHVDPSRPSRASRFWQPALRAPCMRPLLHLDFGLLLSPSFSIPCSPPPAGACSVFVLHTALSTLTPTLTSTLISAPTSTPATAPAPNPLLRTPSTHHGRRLLLVAPGTQPRRATPRPCGSAQARSRCCSPTHLHLRLQHHAARAQRLVRDQH